MVSPKAPFYCLPPGASGSPENSLELRNKSGLGSWALLVAQPPPPWLAIWGWLVSISLFIFMWVLGCRDPLFTSGKQAPAFCANALLALI